MSAPRPRDAAGGTLWVAQAGVVERPSDPIADAGGVVQYGALFCAGFGGFRGVGTALVAFLEVVGVRTRRLCLLSG